VTVPITGCPLGPAYNVPVTIAGGQTYQLSIDTGSTDTGVALTTCSSCGVSPEYAAASGTCSGTASTQYEDGSGWNGEVCSALVQVGGEMPAVTIDFAGITSQQQFFSNIACDGSTATQSLSEGILGLGPLDLDTIGSSNDDAYFSELVQQGVIDTMAVLLCSVDGVMWFGGYDPSYATGSPQYTAMTDNQGWLVSLSSIGLGTTNLGGADSQSVVDTGTSLFYMPTSAFNSLVSALSTDSGATSVFGSGALGTSFFSSQNVSCISPTGGQTQPQIDAALPPLTLTFPGVNGGSFTLSLPATQSYLLPVPAGSALQYCAGVADEGAQSGQTIIGDTALRANITIFDEGNQQIGFAPQGYCE
jgi:hypothetical protein